VINEDEMPGDIVLAGTPGMLRRPVAGPLLPVLAVKRARG